MCHIATNSKGKADERNHDRKDANVDVALNKDFWRLLLEKVGGLHVLRYCVKLEIACDSPFCARRF